MPVPLYCLAIIAVMRVGNPMCCAYCVHIARISWLSGEHSVLVKPGNGDVAALLGYLDGQYSAKAVQLLRHNLYCQRSLTVQVMLQYCNTNWHCFTPTLTKGSLL
jgi:hypothetical protein